jgi:hypothetical protein
MMNEQGTEGGKRGGVKIRDGEGSGGPFDESLMRHAANNANLYLNLPGKTQQTLLA